MMSRHDLRVRFSCCRPPFLPSLEGMKRSVDHPVVFGQIDGEKGSHEIRIELRPATTIDLGQNLVSWSGGTIGPGGTHRIEGIGDGDDACDEGNLLAGNPVGISRPSHRSW